MKLTVRQKAAMAALNAHVGKTVNVLLGEPVVSMNPDFAKSAACRTTGPTLRGLHAKGFVRITNSFWRGATVEVLRAMTPREEQT